MDKKEAYTNLLLSVLLIILIDWQYPLKYFKLVLLVVVLLGLIISTFRSLNNSLWRIITKFMQAIMQPVLAAFVYFGIVVPIGLLFRLFKSKKNSRKGATTFEDVNSDFNSTFFSQQW